MARLWVLLLSSAGVLAGCPAGSGDSGDGTPIFNNTTDPTNGGATYIGSAACSACHPDVHGLTRLHGHSHALSRTEGAPPEYPAEATRAGVPEPPAGRTWNDISYVISGYTKGAFFVDQGGYLLTDGVVGANAQWNLEFPPNGTAAGFVAYKPEQVQPLPYEFECFRCHTTGPRAQGPDNPRSQDGRAGIRGTWLEAGVECEACHGPGSNHAPRPERREIYVNSSAAACGRCHAPTDDPRLIPVSEGYLNPNAQSAELLASGGHARFSCGTCHDPHASTTYDRARGIRNACTVCHGGANLAFHENLVFRRGDYSERVTCESCHMPFTGRSNSSAAADVAGVDGRIGDVRGHIFRIAAESGDRTTMFDASGTAVATDSSGRAAVTLDFVCLRCHSGAGNAFRITPAGAAAIAPGMHQKADRP